MSSINANLSHRQLTVIVAALGHYASWLEEADRNNVGIRELAREIERAREKNHNPHIPAVFQSLKTY